jgi:hypothetical protein
MRSASPPRYGLDYRYDKANAKLPKDSTFCLLMLTLLQYCNTIKLCRSDANSFYLSAAQAIELAHRNQSDRKLINKRPDLTLLLQANWMASDNTTFFLLLFFSLLPFCILSLHNRQFNSAYILAQSAHLHLDTSYRAKAATCRLYICTFSYRLCTVRAIIPSDPHKHTPAKHINAVE